MMYSNFKVVFFNFDFYMYYSYKTPYTVLVAFLKCPYLNFGYAYIIEFFHKLISHLVSLNKQIINDVQQF